MGEGRFGKCLKTHLERALSDGNNDDSCFYHSFPSKSNAHANYNSKEGNFEYLTAYAGVGFSGMVQAKVGQNVIFLNPSLRVVLYQFLHTRLPGLLSRTSFRLAF